MTKPKKAQRVAVDTSNRPTVVAFVLDETGSMSSHKTATIHGYNNFLKEQREQSGECLMTLTKFDSTQQTSTPFRDIPLGMVPDLTDTTFLPGTSTNLYDAVGQQILELSRLESWTVKPNVLVIVMTDGQDNASRTFNVGTVAKLIRSKEDWTFVFLGADAGSIEIAHRMGFAPGNCKLYNVEQMRDTMAGLSAATSAYRSSGSVATISYFAN